METIIGIDLGATNSVAAWMSPNGPQLIPNAIGTNLTPSIIGIDEEGKLCSSATRPRSCRFAATESMCLPFKTADGYRLVRHHRREKILSGGTFQFGAAFAKGMRSLFRHQGDAHRCDGSRFFNDRQAQATIAAGKIAGLQVERS